jgi:uncharacterized protein DUF6456
VAGASPRQIRFVRLLIGAKGARKKGHDRWIVETPSGRASIGVGDAETLVDAGVLQVRGVELGQGQMDAGILAATDLAKNWLRRVLAENDPHATQHRILVTKGEGEPALNLGESPLARLARRTAGGPGPFLQPHQFEAGERIRALVEKAALRPRTTMNYSAEHTASGKNGNCVTDLADMALDARARIASLKADMTPDCFSVLIDVCGYLKGLQQIEVERRWPRRSAKIVLRIALDVAATHFGIHAVARGPANGKTRNWSETANRMDMFPDTNRT